MVVLDYKDLGIIAGVLSIALNEEGIYPEPILRVRSKIEEAMREAGGIEPKPPFRLICGSE